VLAIALADLYRLETSQETVPPGDDLQKWLDETGRSDLGYSDILALLAPDPEGRRAYLAKHFEGVSSGETHRALAQFAAEGLVTVFVTTNFDRLFETALLEVGITPIVVTSGDDLRRVTQREHATVYIVKAYGDYLQQTIRNTPEELASLDPEMEQELAEVFSRYGIVVLGYSGGDEAVGRLMHERDSRYGLYWVFRSAPSGAAAEIVEACGAKVILRDTASEAMVDLRRKIEVFRAHPSGTTPDLVAGEVVRLLRASDEIGLRELIKDEWRTFEGRLDELVAERSQQTEGDETVSFEREFMPSMERMLAALFPLIEYRPELFGEQAARMTRNVERAYAASGAWPELGQWAMWWLAQACGAFAVCYERFQVTARLNEEHVVQHTRRGALATMYVSDIGQQLGRLVMAQYSSQSWCAAYWEQLAKRLDEIDFVRERYPELVEPNARRWLMDFNFLSVYRTLKSGEGVVALWAMSSEGATALCQRLVQDSAYRSRVAEAVSAESVDGFLDDLLDTYRTAREQRRVGVPSRCFWESGALDWLARREQT